MPPDDDTDEGLRKKSEESGSLSPRDGRDHAASGEWFRRALERSDVFVVVVDARGRILLCNDYFLAVTGADRDGIVGKSWKSLAPADGGVPDPFGPHQAELLTRKGERRLVRWHETAIADPAGTVAVTVNLGEDVTEQRRMRDAMRRTEARYRAFIAQSSEGIWRLELDPPVPVTLSEEEQVKAILASGRVAECNDAMARLHGRSSAEDLAGARLLEVFSPEDARPIDLFGAFVRARYRLSEAESRSRLEDGRTRCFVHAMTGVVEAGRLVRAWGVQRDETERREIESERAARLARVEMLDSASQALAEVGLDYRAALEVVVRRAAELVGETCALGLSRDGGTGLELLAVHHRDPIMQAAIHGVLSTAPRAIAGTAVDRVLATGEPVRLASPNPDEFRVAAATQYQIDVDDVALVALLIVPLKVHGQVLGVLVLGRRDAARAYSAEDQVFVQTLADRAALTVKNAQLHAENLRQAEELRRANQDLERRIRERTRELEMVNEQLLEQAIRDGLTGLANRRHFNTVLALELRRARRDTAFLSLLLCDVDFFKRYNDRYGHLAGDQCLVAVAAVLNRTFRRATDLCARFGGEEFAVILSGCGPGDAARLGERLRQAVAAEQIPHEESDVARHLTISVGVASHQVGAETTPDFMVERADRALYASKEGGRNRVTLLSGGDPEGGRAAGL